MEYVVEQSAHIPMAPFNDNRRRMNKEAKSSGAYRSAAAVAEVAATVADVVDVGCGGGCVVWSLFIGFLEDAFLPVAEIPPLATASGRLVVMDTGGDLFREESPVEDGENKCYLGL